MNTTTALETSLPVLNERAGYCVCWGAVLAGAIGAASLSLILLMLGVGLGLSSASPWSDRGASAEALGASTILWLGFTQLAASAMGGYLAGRLRRHWVSLHPDESYFRDTAHGFLAWSVATLATAALLGTVIGTIVSGGSKAAGAAAAGATSVTAAAAAGAASVPAATPAYFTDALFRTESAASAPAPAPAPVSAPAPAPAGASSLPRNAAAASSEARSNGARSAEVARIFDAAGAGPLPPADLSYVGRLVAERTGLSQADAEKRVADVYSLMRAKMNAMKDEAKVAADKARKASALGTLWGFISLLIGAFVASFAATLGGRHRDQF